MYLYEGVEHALTFFLYMLEALCANETIKQD